MRVFPLIIIVEFFLASVVYFMAKDWLKGLFYFFSGAINAVVLFM
jgi:hypothetical protein